ncbi:DNA mismatch repair endonuclease MutL [Tumebacillus permanentifrigoris]|uniref:DNA mismatch repair protein MutL n=1 Tax=Tumebacillus permanentifrigoris TaxID=378543 RepID=A0A316D597_9BACL|nr:DNA mismatch repair endonuclease MutL [Tumebacillus permanentifrigoris]PWK06601.1 DNA mismatch repair protein MutL [Tumebacillus permanentifrigoris]
MGKIQILSDLLANKIAAGEVVERPAAVIKELLENAIDAGSTEIVIEIENGGLDLIKVSDNGIGMEREDALLAFERHATSKIRSEKDLFRIRTLGFRGEALPSIASVSKVEIKTRTAEANEGTLVKIEGGQVLTHGVVAAKKGTEFAVRDLFFNTPARLKYLRTIQTELHHMLDYVNRLSLAHPTISFTLYHNGRQLVQSPGDGELLHSIAAIYGNDVARQMLPIEWSDYDYKIVGAVGFPELNRANRNHCSFFVNGRYVKSYQLLNAVQAAYHTRLPINRYPVCVIALELDPSLVDVNVHPQKLEVRFSEERDVTNAVQQAVEQALQQQTFIPKATAKSIAAQPKEKTQQAAFDLAMPNQPAEVPKAPATATATGFSPATRAPSPGINGPKFKDPLPNGGAVVRETPSAYQPTHRREERREAPVRQQVDAAMSIYEKGEATPRVEEVVETPQAEAPQVVASPAPELSARSNLPQFRPVAQALGMYVIAQDDTGLFIIDQHAAHEKVLYEKFNKKLADRQIQPLPLLVPLTVELTASESALLQQRIDDLADCQIEVEQFGGTTFLIRSVPDIWEGLETQGLLQELIDELLQEGATPDPRRLIEGKVITKACKSAIKANHWLSMPEMVALCDQLRELDNPFTCPHGRPIIIHMSNYDLEKQFKRVM